MKSISGCLIAVATAMCRISAPAKATEASNFLTGNWAIVDDRFANSCKFPNGGGDQLWFEFARSGGRALHYEAPDLFSVFGGLEVRSEDDSYILTARTRSGEVRPYLRIRPKGPNEADIVRSADAHPLSLRRCVTTETSVTKELSDASLFALSPAYSGGQGFPQVSGDESPADVCGGKIPWNPRAPRRRWVQFDLIGPNHYWAFFEFDSPGPIEGFFDIVSARQMNSETVGLSLQRWGDHQTRDVTIRIGVDRIEIPEVQTTFARCGRDQIGSVGMHRM